MTQVEHYSSRRARRYPDATGRDRSYDTGRADSRRDSWDDSQAYSGSDSRRESRGGTRRDSSGEADRDPGNDPRFDDRVENVGEEDGERRGSHATSYGQGFSWVLLWTIVGALIPGSGMIAAGWRRLGGLLLTLVLAAGLAVAGFVLLGDPLTRLVRLAVDPQTLLALTVVGAVVALAWVLVVVVTHAMLRREAVLTSGQRRFSALVVLALIAGIAVPAYKLSDYTLIQRSLITSKSIFSDEEAAAGSRPQVEKADPWAGKSQVNVLLIGSDAGKGRVGVRPDTLIVASVNTKTGNTVLFSIPRSLQRAPFPNGTDGNQAWPNGYYCPGAAPGAECLINAIWTWAEGSQYYQNAKHPGLRATEDAVEGVLGLKLDTYVMLNLNGFEDFVNAIGGVTVDVHERLPIGGQGTDPRKPYYRQAPGGWIEIGDDQHLDGYHALWFSRSRWASDDYQRVDRQRCMIGAIADQSDPLKVAKGFPQLAKALKNNLATGIKAQDIPAWLDLAQRIQKAKVRSMVFDHRLISTVNPDFDRIHELVTSAVKATSRTPKPAATAPAAGASPGATAPTTPKKRAAPDPTKAQDIKSVC